MEYEYLSVAIASGRADVVPRWAARTMRDVADGRRSLRAAVHPLGFTCLPVVREGHYGVCVHVWPPDLPVTTRVHAHSWDLVSYVLFGQLRNELPVVVDSDASHPGARRVLEVRSSGSGDDIRPTSRLVRCASRRSELAVRDDVYTVPAGTFHNSVADSGGAATVALGVMVSGGADLSLDDPRAGTTTHRVRRTRLGARRTQDLARTLATAAEKLVGTVALAALATNFSACDSMSILVASGSMNTAVRRASCSSAELPCLAPGRS
jgi:hypothetical protein